MLILEKLLPDTTALTGIQDLSLGMPATNHSYWQPHVDVSSAVDSNPLTANGQTGWTTFASVSGGIDLHRNSGNSMLTLSYIGGGSFSNDSSVSNGILQGLNFSERLSYRRYVLSFFDQLMYAPQTAFGAAGIPNGPTLPGGGTLGFGNGYTPGQSILTARGQRLTNFSGGEMDVLLTPRTSLTFVGGYSLLDSVGRPTAQLRRRDLFGRIQLPTLAAEHDWAFLSIQLLQLQQLRSIHKKQYHLGIIRPAHHRQTRISGVWRARHRTDSNATYDAPGTAGVEAASQLYGLHDTGICFD